MNAVTAAPQRRELSPVDVLKVHLNRAADEIKSTLPAHISMDKFQRTAVTAALGNPQLLQCDRQSFLMACNKLALDGLLPDGREAALVPFKTWDSKSRTEKWLVQAMPMAYGLRKKVLQSGEVLSLQVGVVYRAEVESGNFIYEIGMDPPIRHRPALDLTDEQVADSEMVAAYSIARIKNPDGEPFWSVEIMRRFEVLKVRQMSQTGAIGKKKRDGTPIQPKGPWVDHEPEMWKKTVLRRHTKVLPMSSDLIDSFERDQDEERQADTAASILSVEPIAPAVVPTGAQLDNAMLPDNSGDNGVQIDPETGEVFETDPRTGMTIVGEETARELDARSLPQGQDDDGSQVEEGNPWDGLVAKVRGGIAAAKNAQYLKSVEDEFLQHSASLPDDVAARLDAEIGAKRKALAAKKEG